MKRPLGLTIIGFLFILGGALALFEVIRNLSHGRINFNFAALMIPVGIGLLKGRSSSRSWAKFWVGFFVVVASALLVAYTFSPDNWHVRFGSDELHGVMREIAAVTIPVLLIVPGVIAWKYLRSRKLDSFFGEVTVDAPGQGQKGEH
jgi:hypothetical protein